MPDCWEGAQPYLLLEYVQGNPIDAYCASNELGVEQPRPAYS